MSTNYWENYFNSIAQIRDSTLMQIPNIGLPVTRALIITRNDAGNMNNYIVVTPRPIIEEVYPRSDKFNNINSLDGVAGEFLVKGVSIAYPRDVLEPIGAVYYVDGVVESGVVTGKKCTLMSIDRKPTTWEMRLQYRINDVGVYSDEAYYSR